MLLVLLNDSVNCRILLLSFSSDFIDRLPEHSGSVNEVDALLVIEAHLHSLFVATDYHPIFGQLYCQRWHVLFICFLDTLTVWASLEAFFVLSTILRAGGFKTPAAGALRLQSVRGTLHLNVVLLLQILYNFHCRSEK